MILTEPLLTKCGSESHCVMKMAEDRLRTSPYRAIRNVSCECRRKTLYLKGQLPSYYLKQLAQEVVLRLNGAAQLVNEIEVARHGY